jgi:hypothetical protein
MGDFAGVVFAESFLEVLGDADVMGIGLGEGVEEVDVVKGHGSSVSFFGERPPVWACGRCAVRDLRS